MVNYLKNSYKKFTNDVLAQALYDVGKYAIGLLALFGILKLIPKDFLIGNFLNKEISLTILQLFFVLFVAVSATIIIYFLINRKRFAIIKHDLHTDELTGIPNHRALSQD